MSKEPAPPAAGGWGSFNVFAPFGNAIENSFEAGLDACAPGAPRAGLGTALP